jgi:hypothetical protein
MREFGEQSAAGGTHEGTETHFDHGAWERTMRHQRIASRLLAVVLIALLARVVAGGAGSGGVLQTVVFAVMLLGSLLLTRYGVAAEPPDDGA